MKKTILMLPSWYPTKENSFNGCFFREQALELKNNFNFIVINYSKKCYFPIIYLFRTLFCKTKPKIEYIQNDEGLEEYSLFDFGIKFIFFDELYSKILLKIKKNKHGIGKIENPLHEKILKSHIRYLKTKKMIPDFNLVYSLTAQDMAYLGHNICTVYKTPHITAEHAPFPWPGFVLSNKIVEAIESADAFLAISNDKIRQVLLQNVQVTPIWVGNFCNETKFHLSNSSHIIPTFLIVAANSFYKNYPLFIKAMEELKSIAVKNFKIIIAGYNANKGYSENAKNLENMIKNSTIASNTQMIEAVERNDIPALYNKCDVFVMTSIQEGLPVSALEASMSGLPVFSTRCGGVEDYVDDNMGRIFDITDYKGIANACNDYLNGKIKFDSKYIREHAVSLFGKEAFTERMKGIFEKII